MLSRDDYDNFWLWQGEIVDASADGELIATLAAHVDALQQRIDKLPHPDNHDPGHPDDCRCYATQCACAYEYYDSKCGWHYLETLPND